MSWPSSLASGEALAVVPTARRYCLAARAGEAHARAADAHLPSVCRSIGAELPDDVTLQDIIKTMPPEVRCLAAVAPGGSALRLSP